MKLNSFAKAGAAVAVFAAMCLCAVGCSSASDAGGGNASSSGANVAPVESSSSSAATEAGQMSVNVDLKSSVGSEYAADSPMQFSAENVSVAIPEGGTALDALQATDREVTTSGEGDSVEIESIGGLGRGDAGDGSHWEMSVNGQVETSSPAVTVLKSGDTVTFDFVQ